jgi:prevent-host-death family protein
MLWLHLQPQEDTVKFANVRELKSKTSEMLRTVERGNTVLVTTHGRPTAMLVPVTEEDIEDVLLAYSPVLRKRIEDGLKDVRAGRTMRLSQYVTTRKKSTRGKRDLRGFPFRKSATRSRRIPQTHHQTNSC